MKTWQEKCVKVSPEQDELVLSKKPSVVAARAAYVESCVVWDAQALWPIIRQATRCQVGEAFKKIDKSSKDIEAILQGLLYATNLSGSEY